MDQDQLLKGTVKRFLKTFLRELNMENLKDFLMGSLKDSLTELLSNAFRGFLKVFP